MKDDLAIKHAVNNIAKEGLTDIFPTPFEIDLLKTEEFKRHIQDSIRNRISGNSLQNLKVHPISHVLFPKKEAFDFRRAALMHPMDTAIYLALVLSISDEIEKHRISKNKNVVFSYRIKPKDGYLFDAKYNFTAFNKYVNKLSKTKSVNVLVKCDISNFYDRINIHRIESSLLGIGIPHTRVKLINELLLFWANRDSYSLPTGSNASRILAESALISIDNFLTSNKIKYCRYVDDFRLFAPNIKTAHSWLSRLVERLHLEGLSINPSKTSIEDVSTRHKDKQTNTETKEKKHERQILIVGYSGTIPTKFRELSEKEIADISKEDESQYIHDLEDKIILQPDDVKRYLKRIIAQRKYSKIDTIPDFIEKFPQFIPYTIDILIKKSSHIDQIIKNNIKNFFKEKLLEHEIHPEYILISIVKLFGTKEYRDTTALMDYFRNLKRNSGSYIGRATLDAIFNLASRPDVLEIRQYYNRADPWEKRAIIRLVNHHLTDEEKRAWIKNIKIHSADDIFALEIADPRKKTKKKSQHKTTNKRLHNITDKNI